MSDFTVVDRRGMRRSAASSNFYVGDPNTEMRRLRQAGYTLPKSPVQARIEAKRVADTATRTSLTEATNRSIMSEMRRNRMASGMRRTGSNVQMAMPKVREPFASLEDRGIPYDTQDLRDLSTIRRWCRLWYTTHDLVPLLIDIYSKFPVVGLEFRSTDKKIQEFYEQMFMDDLNYGEFLSEGLGREFFTCMVAGTPVMTQRGHKPVEDVSVGDLVLTRSGEFKPVLGTTITPVSEEVVSVRPRFGQPVTMTARHRVWVRRDGVEQWIEAKDIRGQQDGVADQVYVPVPAPDSRPGVTVLNLWDHLDRDSWRSFGDVIVDPPNKSRGVRGNTAAGIAKLMSECGYGPDDIFSGSGYKRQAHPRHHLFTVTDDFLWFLGVVIGDGNATPDKGTVKIIFNAHEVDFAERAAKVWYQITGRDAIIKHVGNQIDVHCHDWMWTHVLRDMTYRPDKSRRLPFWFTDLSPTQAQALYQGLSDSDGYTNESGLCFTQSDRYLIEDAAFLVRSFGVIPRVYNLGCHPTSFSRKNQYSLRPARHSSYFEKEDDGYWVTVWKTGRESYTGNVYDLTVQDDHSFVVSGFSVHNCGEVTSLAHFNESLGIWSSEEVLNPEMIRVSKSLFVQQERIQLMVKELVENLRSGPSGGGDAEETPSERLERTHEYCCTPKTKVLTADLQWVPVDSLKVGDPIMGFDEYPRPGKGNKRQWVPTRVTATKSIAGNTYRVVTDGPSVECTDQHRWLAVPQNRNETLPIDTTQDEEFYPTYDWRGKEIARSKPWILRPCNHCGIPMELRPSAAAVTKFCSKRCSNSVKNRQYSSGLNSGQLMWVRTDELRPGDKIMHLGLWDVEDNRDTGWMGGFLDGEGTLGKTGITFSQNVGPVLDRALSILGQYKFDYSYHELAPHQKSGKVCAHVRIKGGQSELLRALSIFRPVRLLERLADWINGAQIAGDWVTVTEVTHLGSQEVIALATSSKTLIAEGMFSHNTQLLKHYPEVIKAAAQDDGLDISDALVSRLVNKAAPWDLRGTPHLLRSFRTLMMEESLNQAQNAVCDRLYAPLILATMGIENMGDGEPWIPNQGELDDLRDDMQNALAADFKLLVHNFGVNVQSVFGRESVPRFDSDYDRIDAKLLQAWGIGQALIAGGSGAGGAYASSALNREVCEQLMLTFQKKVLRHMRKRAEVIAEAQEHYDYELKGGVRVPIYREIVQFNEETGEDEIVRVPKLLIPEIEFDTLNLRDEAQERQFIAQLKEMGVPVSDGTLAVNIPIKFREELEKQAEETVSKGLAKAQAMKKLQAECDAQGLPYPDDLVASLSATLQLRQGLAQTEMVEGQADMQEQQIKQMQAPAAASMGLIPGLAPPPPPEEGQQKTAASGPDADGPTASGPGGVEHGGEEVGLVELPRNRQRPVESDEQRASMPKRLSRGPSSYGQAKKVPLNRVERAIRRRASGVTVDDLVHDPETYAITNMEAYESQIVADWPEILAGGAPDSRKLLEELLEQYEEVMGVQPRW